MATKGHDFVLEVIEKYRGHECLWQITNDCYHDKVKRGLAWDDMLSFFRTKDPNVTLEVVQKKIQNMRSCYQKELRKVKASEGTGTGVDDIHVPKLWYFSHLHFMNDQVDQRTSKTTSSIIEDLPFGENEVSDSIDSEQSVSSPASVYSTSSSKQFKGPATKADLVLEKISKRLDVTGGQTAVAKLKNKHEAFGEHVAEKLRSIDPEMVPFCQKMISEVLFFAELRTLNVTSRIVTDNYPPPPPLTSSHDTSSGSINKVMQAYEDAMDDEYRYEDLG